MGNERKIRGSFRDTWAMWVTPIESIRMAKFMSAHLRNPGPYRLGYYTILVKDWAMNFRRLLAVLSGTTAGLYVSGIGLDLLTKTYPPLILTSLGILGLNWAIDRTIEAKIKSGNN